MNSSGSRIVIGVPQSNSIGFVAVYDYKIPTTNEWNNGKVIKGETTTQITNYYYWTQVGYNISGPLNGKEFGHSVAMSSDGERIVIGAPLYDKGKGLVVFMIGMVLHGRK